MSADQKVFRNRIVLGLIGILCTMDCRHFIPTLLIDYVCLVLILGSWIDGWMSDK